MAGPLLVAFGSAPLGEEGWTRLAVVESRGVARWSHVAIRAPLEGERIVPAGADRAMLAIPEVEARNGGRTAHRFLLLGNPPQAIEEAFSKAMRHQDMARAMRLPGAVSAERFTLETLAGRGDWELLTIYGFEGDDVAAITEALVDSADIWDGDPSCILMRVERIKREGA